MEISNIGNLSQNEPTTKSGQTVTEPESALKQQAEFVSSQGSQASRAYATAQIGNSRNVAFEGKYEKLADLIKNTTSPGKVHLDFDEVSNLLKHLGYDIKAGKGSHCTVDILKARPLTVVRPHGDHKYVDPGTIKDLKALLNGTYTGL